MLVLRGTKKLRDRLRDAPAAAEDDASTNLLGDWFATVLFWRPQMVLAVNARTYVPVLVPLAPAKTLVARVGDAIADTLAFHGVDETFAAAERAAMAEVRVAPTNNRRVLGVMNEYVFMADAWRDRGVNDVAQGLEALSLQLAQVPLGPLFKTSVTADRELQAVLADLGYDAPGPGTAEASAPVIPLRPDATANPASAASSAEQRRPTRPAHRNVYRLKIMLQHIKPPVWRRVLVDGSETLGHLHEVIQAAFGWWNYHLHEFEIDGVRYGVPDPDDGWFGPAAIDEATVRIDQVAGEGTRFDYTYDFGDGWDHRVVVEHIESAEVGVTVPDCVGGRRACPPEDCGGAWGYQRLLEILADPNDPEHDAMTEWLGRPFDSEAFDRSDFAHNLHLQEVATFDP